MNKREVGAFHKSMQFKSAEEWKAALVKLEEEGKLTDANRIQLWFMGTPKQKRHEYFKGSKFESEYPPDLRIKQ